MQKAIKKLLASNKEIKSYIKIANIRAEVAQGGENVLTVLENGTVETFFVANKGDYIITNPAGEQYVVTKEKFVQRYEPCFELGKNCYKPKPVVQKFIQTDEDICLIGSWGNEQFIKAGGFINITEEDNIYGCAKEEFLATYQEVVSDDKNN